MSLYYFQSILSIVSTKLSTGYAPDMRVYSPVSLFKMIFPGVPVTPNIPCHVENLSATKSFVSPLSKQVCTAALSTPAVSARVRIASSLLSFPVSVPESTV